MIRSNTPQQVVVAGVVAVLALLISSCGDDEEPTTAFKLAVIDGENPSGNDDSLLDRYHEALDAATQDCQAPGEDEPTVADMATHMKQEQPDNWTTLSALEAIAEAVPPEMAPTRCTDIAASLLVLTGD